MGEYEHITCSLDILKSKSQSNYTCHICSMVVKTKANLRAHSIKTHKIIENKSDEAFFRKKKDNIIRIYHCPVEHCKYHASTGQGVNKFSILKQHFLWVHTPRMFTCTQCSKSFGTAPALKYHEKQCGQKFMCSKCPAIFNKKRLLDFHGERIHTVSENSFNKIPISSNSEINNDVKVLQPIYVPIIVPMSSFNESFFKSNNLMKFISNNIPVNPIITKKDASTQVDCISEIYTIPSNLSASYYDPENICNWTHNPSNIAQPTLANSATQSTFYSTNGCNNASMQTMPYSNDLYHVQTQTNQHQIQDLFDVTNNNNNNNFFTDAECMTHATGIDWQQLADNQTQTSSVPLDLGFVDLMDIETQTNFQDFEQLFLDES